MGKHQAQLIDAWAAGIVDGDGCITIKFRKRSKKEKCAAYFSLHVIVAQSGEKLPRMLKVLRKNYNGSIGSPYAPSKTRMPRWMWVVATSEAEAFLRRIYPYLIEKADECKLALEYRSKALGRGKWKKAKKYYIKMRQLKNYEKRSPFWLERTQVASGGHGGS